MGRDLVAGGDDLLDPRAERQQGVPRRAPGRPDAEAPKSSSSRGVPTSAPNSPRDMYAAVERLNRRASELCASKSAVSATATLAGSASIGDRCSWLVWERAVSMIEHRTSARPPIPVHDLFNALPSLHAMQPEGDTMHPRHHDDGPRPNVLVRALRGLVFLAFLPAILVAGVILLPVFVIARLVGLGPRGHGLPRPPPPLRAASRARATRRRAA